MPIAAICMSHSPLLEVGDPPPSIVAEIDLAFAQARAFVEDYAPDVVVSFAPDHYNGFFYDLMPQFCIGYEARGIGDFGSSTQPFDVPRKLAERLASAVIEGGVDAAVSLDMRVDHGAVQPLEVLFGGPAAVPVVPVFINSVAPPFTPIERVRRLGELIGATLADVPERVLVLGSGGLSHDPPVPKLATATDAQFEMILRGRNLSVEQRAARQQRVIDGAKAFSAGTSNIQDLNPEWDRAFLDICAAGDTSQFDKMSAKEMAAAAGNSAHEVRTWIAALSAIGANGPYKVTSQYYRPIKELIAGFGVITVASA